MLELLFISSQNAYNLTAGFIFVENQLQCSASAREPLNPRMSGPEQKKDHTLLTLFFDEDISRVLPGLVVLVLYVPAHLLAAFSMAKVE